MDNVVIQCNGMILLKIIITINERKYEEESMRNGSFFEQNKTSFGKETKRGRYKRKSHGKLRNL